MGTVTTVPNVLTPNFTSLILNDDIQGIRSYLANNLTSNDLLKLNRFGQTYIQTLCNKSRVPHVLFLDFIDRGFNAMGCLLGYCMNEYCTSQETSRKFIEVLYKHDPVVSWELVFWLVYKNDLDKLRVIVKLSGVDCLYLKTPVFEVESVETLEEIDPSEELDLSFGEVEEPVKQLEGGDTVLHFAVLYCNNRTIDFLLENVPELVYSTNNQGLSCLQLINFEGDTQEDSIDGLNEEELKDGTTLQDNIDHVYKVLKLRAGSEILKTGSSDFSSFLTEDKIQLLLARRLNVQ